MTLLAEIQQVMERTYSPAGINLEDCLIARPRREELLARTQDPCARNGDACTFLRQQGDNLYLAIFYAPRLIRILEQEDPRQCVSHRNVGALIAFMEEIAHGLHAALAFRRGRRRWDSEAFACAMEAQARVDIYYLLLWLVRRVAGTVTAPARDWVREVVFARERYAWAQRRLSRRYALAGKIARGFVHYADQLPPAQRLQAIRQFHALDLIGKSRMARVNHMKRKFSID